MNSWLVGVVRTPARANQTISGSKSADGSAKGYKEGREEGGWPNDT